MTEGDSNKMDVEQPSTSSKVNTTKKASVARSGSNPSSESESASQYPDMEVAQNIHRLIMKNNGKLDLTELKKQEELGTIPKNLKETLQSKIITELENPALYRYCMTHIHDFDNDDNKDTKQKLQELEEKNKLKLQELEKAVEDAKESAGDMEVLDARFEIARFAAKSLSKDDALDAYNKILLLPKLSSGKTIDAYMEVSRVASFYNDTDACVDFTNKAMKKAADWDRRNRLRVYNALQKLSSRDIKDAAALLIECIATFSCTELCTYKDFVVYTIISNLLHLPRTELKEKIIDGPEILTLVGEIPIVSKLVNSLYDCDYKGYLHAMVDVQSILLSDRFFQPHTGYIMRELHVLGYKQFLDSYKSVTLDRMAKSFGVSPYFLDLQLSRFIAAGRLTAKIDKVGGVVETNRPDLKNAQYKDMIMKGDLLLNRIQKLGRVMDL